MKSARIYRCEFLEGLLDIVHFEEAPLKSKQSSRSTLDSEALPS
jgi:hypothetical protein